MSTARIRRPNTARLGRLSNGMLMTPEEFDAATDFDELYSYELGEPAEQIIKEHEIYRTTLLTGFELPLVRLLKVADDWAGPVRARKNCHTGLPG
jgi:hypothetical protein